MISGKLKGLLQLIVLSHYHPSNIYTLQKWAANTRTTKCKSHFNLTKYPVYKAFCRFLFDTNFYSHQIFIFNRENNVAYACIYYSACTLLSTIKKHYKSMVNMPSFCYICSFINLSASFYYQGN